MRKKFFISLIFILIIFNLITSISIKAYKLDEKGEGDRKSVV